jgi:putative SOS response-associated peptidase YedK
MSRRTRKPQISGALIDSIGNLEPELDLYPDQMGPIVRNTGAGRELAMVRWGLPSSQQALMQAAKKRADKLQAKGTPFDCRRRHARKGHACDLTQH